MVVAHSRRVAAAQDEGDDECAAPVHNEELAVTQRVAPRIEQMPWPSNAAKAQCMHLGGEVLETPPHHQIAEAVEDYVDRDALRRLDRQVLLQLAAEGVAFEDERFEIDALACMLNRRDHGVEQLLAAARSEE